MEMTRFCFNKSALMSMSLGSRFREGKDFYEIDQILFQ